FEMYAFAGALLVDGDDELTRRERRPTLTGTPEQVLAELDRFAAAGYSLVNVHLVVRSGTMAEYLELVERFGRDVVPAARALPALASATGPANSKRAASSSKRSVPTCATSPRPCRRTMRGGPSKAQNMTTMRPFSRRCAIVSIPLPTKST